MKTVIDVQIEPVDSAKVTPRELLEDFADLHPAWHFLEDESGHYTHEKGVPACVLRYVNPSGVASFDLVFSSQETHEHSSFRLVLLDPAPPKEQLRLEKRNAVIERFVEAFSDYLERRHLHAHLHVVEKDVDAPEAEV